MQDSKGDADGMVIESSSAPFSEVPQAGGIKWESAPLIDEDREVFIACRKAWLKDMNDEQDFDEQSYSTSSIEPIDVVPYLVTVGYSHEKERMQESLRQILRIKELRKKYNVPSLSEEPWNPKWEFASVSLPEIEQNWPLHLLGTDNEGRVVLWDKSGNLDSDWTSKVMNNEESKNALTFYCLRQLENTVRKKIAISKKTGFRMTRHIIVLDAYSINLANLSAVKGMMDRILGDVQVMYPETLKRLYIINTGWLFKAAWMVIRNFVHPITAAKVVILGTSYRTELSQAGITEIPGWVM